MSKPSKKGRWSGGRHEAPSERATGTARSLEGEEEDAALMATESSTEATRTTLLSATRDDSPAVRSRPWGRGKMRGAEDEGGGRLSSSTCPVVGQRESRRSPTRRGREDGPREGSNVGTYLKSRSINSRYTVV